MQKSLSPYRGLLAAAALALVAGCSSNGSQPSAAIPGAGAAQSVHASNILASGIAPKFATMVRLGLHQRARIRPSISMAKLFVSDFGTGTEEILRGSRYMNAGSITDQLTGPDGNWFGSIGLFVADYSGIHVLEYGSNPGPGAPAKFVYNAGMIDPVGVTTDSNNHVYEADYNTGSPGFVNEYAHKSNSVMATCAVAGAAEGVAVDGPGNVFVSYQDSTASAGYVAEFSRRSWRNQTCTPTVLPPTFEFVGGMVLDNHKNIVVCDQLAGAVYVVAAPDYTSVTPLITGLSDPFHVTLNKNNSQAYVADVATAVVYVLSYPDGALLTTLGSANGLTDPASAASNKGYQTP